MQVSGGLLMAYASGAIIGPLLAGVVFTAYSPQAMFVYTAAVNGILVLFALYRMGIRGTLAASQRRAVINLPGGQFTAGHLYTALREQLDWGRSDKSDDKHDESTDNQEGKN